MRLYGINESDIIEILENPDKIEVEGNRYIAYKNFSGRFSGFPLKVVYIIEKEEIIITVYPLKKPYRRKQNED